MNCAWHNSKCQLNCRICNMNLKNQAKFNVHIAKNKKQSTVEMKQERHKMSI